MIYCKRCKKDVEEECFSTMKNGKRYKSCDTCRGKGTAFNETFFKKLVNETGYDNKSLKNIVQCMAIPLSEEENTCRDNRKYATKKYRRLFKRYFPNERFPKLKNRCFCGELIKIHYIFMDKDGNLVKKANNKALILGSQCRFKTGLNGKAYKKCRNCNATMKRTKDKYLCIKCEKEQKRLNKMSECEVCGDLHRNRKNNLCNNCRLSYKYCCSCDLIIKKQYRRCYDCYIAWKNNN